MVDSGIATVNSGIHGRGHRHAYKMLSLFSVQLNNIGICMIGDACLVSQLARCLAVPSVKTKGIMSGYAETLYQIIGSHLSAYEADCCPICHE